MENNGGYGINLTGTSSGNLVTRNELVGNALGDINDDGSGNHIVLGD